MSFTYTWGDVTAMISDSTSRLIVDRNGATICNLCQNAIWDEYDWRESMSLLPPFNLIPNRQDHGPPFSSVPDDFKGLRKVRVAYVAPDPPYFYPLSVLRHVEHTNNQQLPHAITYEPSRRAFRLFPRVPQNIGSPFYFIEGTYKNSPTKITTSNINTEFLPFDDEHIDVFIEGMKWSTWMLSGDQRAGGTQVQDNFKVHTGQKANFYDAITSMAEEFGLNDGDQNISPSEPLVDSGIYGNPFAYPGHFGIR